MNTKLESDFDKGTTTLVLHRITDNLLNTFIISHEGTYVSLNDSRFNRRPNNIGRDFAVSVAPIKRHQHSPSEVYYEAPLLMTVAGTTTGMRRGIGTSTAEELTDSLGKGISHKHLKNLAISLIKERIDRMSRKDLADDATPTHSSKEQTEDTELIEAEKTLSALQSKASSLHVGFAFENDKPSPLLTLRVSALEAE